MMRHAYSGPPVSDELPILLRAYVESAAKKASKPRQFAPPELNASEWSLVFDTETTTDPGQSLRIGFCRVYYSADLRRHVLFYDPDNLSNKEVTVVTRYGKSAGIELMTRDDFVATVFYKYGYHLRAMIVGFNLPFDFSRLAVAHAPARGMMRGGFSLKLSPVNYLPPIQIRHLSKYVSMMRFAAPFVSPTNRSQLRHGRKVPHKRGYFLELRALAAALFSRSFSLASLAEFLGVEHRKLDTGSHGAKLTRRYLEYAERDVLTSWECFQELSRRYHALGLKGTPVHRIFSEASIGKANFVEMGIRPWLSIQRPSRKLLAIILSAYFGGRSEVRIRRELRQVMLCDFLSMYPTVCTLMCLWPFVIGQGMTWRDGTEEITGLLRSWNLEDMRSRANWRRLVALVQVAPDADIFPIRAQYNESPDGTIGTNYLSNKAGQWFTLADCLAAQLLTGKTVKVLRAVVFQHGPAQHGLKPIAISGNSAYLVDPYKDDFYKRLIELRQVVKQKRDDLTGKESAKLDVEQNAIKIATNATSYGIFAEINVNDRAKKAASRVFGANSPSYLVQTLKDEQPGRYFHPLLAASITGGARLMLAIAERLILNQGLEWAFCDTDSMAIAKPQNMEEAEFYKRVDRITAWFDSLNPYGFSGPILKIEDVNYSLKNPKKRQPLFVWAVSAKRYALFNIEGVQPVIRKASAHGLGHLQAPYNDGNPAKGIPAPKTKLSKIGVEHWHHDLWWLIAKSAIDGRPDDIQFNHHPALKMPAASRYAATTPKYLRWFERYNDGLPYARKLKPFGFVSAFSVRALIDEARPKSKAHKSHPAAKPVSPFNKNPMIAAKNAFDRNTREPILVEHLKTYGQALAQYPLHPEDKFLNGDFLDRGNTSRRHVRVTGIEFIGKESNKWEDQNYFGFDAEEDLNYGQIPMKAGKLSAAVGAIVGSQGLRATALQLRISRTKLSKLLENDFADCSAAFLQAIARIVGAINSRQNQEIDRNAELLKAAQLEIQKIGLLAFAERIGYDPSNLRKQICGRRKTASLADRLNLYFSKLGKPKPDCRSRQTGA